MNYVTLREAVWRKSSYSRPAGEDCVEVAKIGSGGAIRDSKNTTGPILVLNHDAWRSLLHRAKHGRHDLPA